MAFLRFSPAITSVTFVTAGVIAITAGVSAAVGAGEATSAVQGYQLGGIPQLISSDPVTGNCIIQLPLVITSITINAHVYNANGAGQISAVVPLDANELLYQSIKLITG